MRQKEPALSYTGAIEEYYGGVHRLNKQGVPFTCRCGGKTYKEKIKDTDIERELPVMHLKDCFKHIRSVHKERIKKYKNA